MLLKNMAFIVVAIVLMPPITQAEEITVTLTNKSFLKNGDKFEKLSIKAGDTIRFLNEDPWLHNIYSLSDLKTFVVGSYPQGQSKFVTFEKPGQGDIECAIHPNMLFHLEVQK